MQNQDEGSIAIFEKKDPTLVPTTKADTGKKTRKKYLDGGRQHPSPAA